jgi:hypothetical protein
VVKSSVWKGIILSIVWVIVLFALTYASGEDHLKFQGKIMNLDLQKKIMIINERPFAWDNTTIMNNSNGSTTTIDKFKSKSWVYVEGEIDKVNKRTMIRRIYLLPKHIDKNERERYPFMQ